MSTRYSPPFLFDPSYFDPLEEMLNDPTLFPVEEDLPASPSQEVKSEVETEQQQEQPEELPHSQSQGTFAGPYPPEPVTEEFINSHASFTSCGVDLSMPPQANLMHRNVFNLRWFPPLRRWILVEHDVAATIRRKTNEDQIAKTWYVVADRRSGRWAVLGLENCPEIGPPPISPHHPGPYALFSTFHNGRIDKSDETSRGSGVASPASSVPSCPPAPSPAPGTLPSGPYRQALTRQRFRAEPYTPSAPPATISTLATFQRRVSSLSNPQSRSTRHVAAPSSTPTSAPTSTPVSSPTSSRCPWEEFTAMMSNGDLFIFSVQVEKSMPDDMPPPRAYLILAESKVHRAVMDPDEYAFLRANAAPCKQRELNVALEKESALRLTEQLERSGEGVPGTQRAAERVGEDLGEKAFEWFQ